MLEDHPTQHSVLVSRTAIAITDSGDEAEDVDALILYPDLADLWVSPNDPVLHARASPTWFQKTSKKLVERKTSNDRCKTCLACTEVKKKTCIRLKTLPCYGCAHGHTCRAQLPCDKWLEIDKARHYAQFSVQLDN